MPPNEEDNKDISELFAEINDAIAENTEDFDLYYQRGYLHYGLGDYENAEADYIKAVMLGLDCTKIPYYTYAENFARAYSTRDKIVLWLFVVSFVIILILESISFFYKIGLLK